MAAPPNKPQIQKSEKRRSLRQPPPQVVPPNPSVAAIGKAIEESIKSVTKPLRK